MNETEAPRDLPQALETLAKVQDRSIFGFSLRLIGVQVILLLLCLPFALAVNWITQQFGVVDNVDMDKMISEMSPLQALLVVGLIGPFIETILFQVFAVELTRLFTKNVAVQLIVVAGLFCLAHFSNNVLSGILAGGVGGFILGLAYLVGRQRSFGRAFLGTFLTHAMWNTMVVSIALGAEALVRYYS